MLTKTEYLEIRDNHSKDTSPVYYYLWMIRGKTSLSSSQFNKAFWTWIFNVIGVHNFPIIQGYVFTELDKHFGVKS
jgi:hypothetical protein